MVEGKHIHTAEQEKEPAGEPPPLRSRLAARTGFGDKTLWDVLQLLIVPLALAAIGFFFSLQQDRRQEAIEDQRAASEQNIEEQRAQDTALQAYLDQMSTLLLEGKLRESEEGNEERTLARARTITVLQRLNPKRKAAVLQFLVEANLVQSVGGRAPILTLRGADLQGAKLSSFNLSCASLNDDDQITDPTSCADLSCADLSGADLSGVTMNGVILRGADLSYARLNNARIFANLSYADLVGADLSGADLSGANLNGAILFKEDLSGVGLTKEERQQVLIQDPFDPAPTTRVPCPER
jgi:Pentapeptide repeats (8 copies)